MEYAQAAQILILLRVLIGKLHEAWELFTKRCLKNQAMRKHLDEETQAELRNLKRHFSRNSPLTRIRNKFSFHYDDEDDLIEEGFKRLPPDELCYFYFGETVLNSFDYTSERVVTSGVLALVAELGNDDHERLSGLVKLTVKIALQIQTVFDLVAGSILAGTGSPPKPTPIKLLGLQRLRAVQIPYFGIL